MIMQEKNCFVNNIYGHGGESIMLLSDFIKKVQSDINYDFLEFQNVSILDYYYRINIINFNRTWFILSKESQYAKQNFQG